MGTITLLGSALGLAALSGINLYATVAITGLAVQLGWVELPTELGGLETLANWWIIGVAGGLYLVEFVADKWPWLDNVWDIAHTFIRPPAAGLVALAATAQTSDPVIQVIAVLLAGGIAFGTHSIKTTARLGVNAASPGEFASNMAISLAEDAVVATTTIFVITHPVLSLILLVVLGLFAIWVTPKLVRVVATQLRATGHALRYLWNWFEPVEWDEPPRRFLGKMDPDTILAALPGHTVKLKRVGWLRNGWLVHTDRKEVAILTRRLFRARPVVWTNLEVEYIDLRMSWLFRTVTLHTTRGKAVFKLYRNNPDHIEAIVREMGQRLGTTVRVRRAKSTAEYVNNWRERASTALNDLTPELG